MDDQRRGDGKIGDREHEAQVGAQGRQGRDQEQDGQVPPPHAEVSGGAEVPRGSEVRRQRRKTTVSMSAPLFPSSFDAGLLKAHKRPVDAA